jgi:IS605 OrfB family transposase
MMPTRSYQTRIFTDDSLYQTLTCYAELFSKVQRHLFKSKVLAVDPNACKRNFLKRFGITGRQYNACQIELQGKIDSIKESRDLRIVELEEKIKGLGAKIKRIRNPFAAHQKKRYLSNLKNKQELLKKDRDQNIIRLCFGSKKLFRAQFALEENGFCSHEEWKIAWQKERSSQFFVLGSKDEAGGNQSCTACLQEDGKLSLRLRIPDGLNLGSYVTIPNVYFAYGMKDIVAALLKKQAISYRFKRDDKGWQIFATVQVQAAPVVTKEPLGRIGIDINSDHLALVEIDRFGNPIRKETIPLSLNGKSTHQSKALIGEASKQVVEMAEKAKKPIVLEKLDFKQKKASLREKRASFARTLSSFAYSSITAHIKSRAQRQGVEIQEVNPAYSSVIGRVKFSKRYGLSIHHAAAVVIARRSLRFSEKPPSSLKDIPDGKGGHVALSLPVRNRGEHVWTFWRRLGKKISAALAARFKAMKNRSMSSCKTAHAT